MLTGENGLLTKANKAEKETDIVDTKEQIKLQLMEVYNAEKTSYTNSDVIVAVKEVTGNTVEENTAIIKSKKGYEVDISDLWVTRLVIYLPEIFSSSSNESLIEVEIEKGQTWTEGFIQNFPDKVGFNKVAYWYFSDILEIGPDNFTNLTLTLNRSPS